MAFTEENLKLMLESPSIHLPSDYIHLLAKELLEFRDLSKELMRQIEKEYKPANIFTQESKKLKLIKKKLIGILSQL